MNQNIGADVHAGATPARETRAGAFDTGSPDATGFGRHGTRHGPFRRALRWVIHFFSYHLVLSRQSIRSTRAAGFLLTVRPTVFHPRYFISSEAFAAFIDRLDLTGKRVIDIGTGTGILAIAAAKRLRRPVLASDVDGAAVRVASHHVRRNGLLGDVRVVCAPGYRSRAVRGSDYDLIFANILARPLALMARDLGRAIAPGGVAILSGLLRRQEALVVAAHRAQGLALARRIVIDGWSTLILGSGRGFDQTGGPGNQR